jgi:hypothetical protein
MTGDKKHKNLESTVKYAVDMIPKNTLSKLAKKAIKAEHFVDTYNETLDTTGSHTKSATIATTELVATKIASGVTTAVAVDTALAIAGAGAFNPLSTTTGIIVGATIYIAGDKSTDALGNNIKYITNNTIEFLDTHTPEIVKKLIYYVISDPIDNVLGRAYNTSKDVIDRVKTGMTEFLTQNFRYINPDSSNTIQCIDKIDRRVNIELDRTISNKIYNYCNKFTPVDFSTVPKFNGTSFSSEFSELKEDFDTKYKILNLNLDKPFVINTPQTITYKPKPLVIPKFQHIPNYNVTISASGSGGGGGGAGFAMCALIAIKFSILF